MKSLNSLSFHLQRSLFLLPQALDETDGRGKITSPIEPFPSTRLFADIDTQYTAAEVKALLLVR